MKPLILAFLMIAQCQGVEKKGFDAVVERDYIEKVVEELANDIIEVVLENSNSHITIITIDPEGNIETLEEFEFDDDIDEFIEELER